VRPTHRLAANSRSPLRGGWSSPSACLPSPPCPSRSFRRARPCTIGPGWGRSFTRDSPPFSGRSRCSAGRAAQMPDTRLRPRRGRPARSAARLGRAGSAAVPARSTEPRPERRRPGVRPEMLPGEIHRDRFSAAFELPSPATVWCSGLSPFDQSVFISLNHFPTNGPISTASFRIIPTSWGKRYRHPQ
jgi:hypothetical protein